MTSLAEEREIQRQWSARLRRPAPVYDTLVENEFAPASKREEAVRRGLDRMMRFVLAEVPHYADSVRPASNRRSLEEFPILTKLDVKDAGQRMQAKRLPDGVRMSHWSESSGTTGRPVRVLHSSLSTSMFSLLKQREYRWFRLDPGGTLASMRMGIHLPRSTDNAVLRDGDMLTRPAWQYLENFSTGPFIAMTLTTPMEARIAWLRKERPDYLMSFAESFELMALAAESQPPVDSLKGLIAISEQVTPGMRTLIERQFGAALHQNYGLNEIGIVAVRCEGGRYHVHSEHCFVEILDDNGRACSAGQSGRIVVTTLTNLAMPLIRYDTGDLAEAVEGPCPCGRTLPAFGEIVGRYSRIAFLPPGTQYQMMVLRETIEHMPLELVRDLREFQIHQYLDKRMELRVVMRTALHALFCERVRSEWERAAPAAAPLEIVRVDAIPRSPGGKAEVFTSDFMPPRNS